MTERYYIGNQGAKVGDKVVLNRGESHHLSCVMRVNEGDVVCLFGAGKEFEGIVRKLRPAVEIEITKERTPIPPPRIALTVAFPWLRGGKSEWVLQKLTELGVERVILFQSNRSVARGDEAKFQRLEKIAIESCKQCERSDVPLICQMASFSNLLSLATELGPTVLLAERSSAPLLSRSLKDIIPVELSRRCPLVIISGPEGGFTPEEIEAAKERVTFASLGPRILRADLAPLVGATVALAMAGDL
jgi:16S rRNA (uracil1498-N3)-methyltransferase